MKKAGRTDDLERGVTDKEGRQVLEVMHAASFVKTWVCPSCGVGNLCEKRPLSAGKKKKPFMVERKKNCEHEGN